MEWELRTFLKKHIPQPTQSKLRPSNMLLPIVVLISLSHQTNTQNLDVGTMMRGPLLPRVFPRPTGTNGLEFYVRATDSATASSSIVKLANRLLDKNPRAPTASELIDLNSVLKLIRTGTTRPVDMNALSRRLPSGAMATAEISTRDMLFSNGLKAITKAVALASETSFKNRKPAKATRDLLLLLKCSHDCRAGSLILSFVSCAIDYIIYAAFNRNLSLITASDAKEILDSTEVLLSTKSYIKAVESETALSLIATDAIMEELSTEVKHPSAPSEDPETQKVLDQYKKLTPTQRVAYQQRARREIPKLMRPRIQQMYLPENRWNFKAVGPSYRKDPLLAYLMSTSGIEHFPVTLVVYAKSRTQMRLLRLHALLEIHQRKHGTYPKNLRQLGAPKEVYDPLANKHFQYRTFSNRYNLYSEGVPQTGVIELVYRPTR